MSPIDFKTIQDQLTPDVQVETNWTIGSAGLPNDNKKLLLMGQMLSTGSEGVPLTTDTKPIRRITSTQQGIDYYGKGSTLAVMIEYALKASPRAKIYAMPYKAGSTPVAADEDIVLATNATGNGEVKFYIMGERFAVGIATGDTPTVVGDAMVALINAHPNLPVTAANVTGTVTITARNAGLPSNSIAIRSEITAGIGMTSTDGAAVLSGGTVAGDPSVQMPVAEAQRFHLMAIESDDATEVAVMMDHQEAASTPAEKRWGLGICGSTDTAANTQTLANGFDSYRAQVVWQENADKPIFVLAAVFAAQRAAYGPRESMDGEVLKNIPAPFDEAAWPNVADIETALEEGIVVLKPNRDSGTSEVVRSVITRQTAPITYRDHMIAEKSDYTDLSIIAAMVVYKGKTLKSASPPGLASTITPTRAVAKVARTLRALDREDILQGVATAVSEGRIYAEVNSSNVTRLDVAFPFFPTQTAHQIMCLKTYETTASL
jgi:phage tail sheath gpL-like